MTNKGRAFTLLRKRRLNGELYDRDPEVETRIASLTTLTDLDLIRVCKLPRASSDHVRSECVLYFFRQASRGGGLALSEELHKILVGRLLKQMPKVDAADGKSGLARSMRIRDYVLDRFTDLLVADSQTYEERLDFFEVRFAAAIARLRDSAERVVIREERRTKPLFHEETGDVLVSVEEAAGAVDPFAIATKYATNYRSGLDAAIASLPPEQQEIVEMIFYKRMPIESKDSSVASIVQATGLVEKTVRNRRDRALAELQRLLTQEDAS